MCWHCPVLIMSRHISHLTQFYPHSNSMSRYYYHLVVEKLEKLEAQRGWLYDLFKATQEVMESGFEPRFWGLNYGIIPQ